MSFYTGDIPSEDIAIAPARSEEPIDLEPFDAAETIVALRAFDGEVVATQADFLTTFEDGHVVLEWPATSVLAVAGLYTLAVTLVGDDVRERLAPIYFVVQDDTTGWHTVDSARDEWTVGEATVDDRRLFQLLELAREQVIAYAPALDADAVVPARYRAAQLMQAQNLYNAGAVDPASGMDGAGETFALRPYPLDWMVKQVLRPQVAVPVVG